MTERQAWTELAEHVEAGANIGLCSRLEAFNVGSAVRNRMLHAVERAVKRHPCTSAGPGRRGYYAWPLTPEGHAARVAFCRRQAARCGRRSKAR